MIRQYSIHLPQRGFSLIELMVGLVIGLLATLAITQAFSAFEGQKRSTSGNADAQTNGSIALVSIQRDVQMAGYGLPLPMADKENSSLKCTTVINFDHDSDVATSSLKLFPVEIQDGAANDSDIITLRYSTTAMGAVPVGIVNAANATAGPGLVVANNIGCHDDDIVLISNGNICRMAAIKDANGSGDTDQNIRLNPTAAGSPLVNGAKLACMGNWQNYTYQIINNELQRNGESMVSEVVNLQAQYGIATTPGSNQVNQWVDASGATWSNPSVTNRNRIKAVRVVVVVRNGLKEKEDVTSACTTAKGTINKGPCAWDDADYSAAPLIDLSIGNADWKQYRYRTFETIIPLRNLLWSKEAV